MGHQIRLPGGVVFQIKEEEQNPGSGEAGVVETWETFPEFLPRRSCRRQWRLHGEAGRLGLGGEWTRGSMGVQFRGSTVAGEAPGAGATASAALLGEGDGIGGAAVVEAA
uniref:Uncharacterized protein n=1 Tax=Leersia perrieri TaxID=77586 RepID=A0A0D9W2N5_9ORYZ